MPRREWAAVKTGHKEEFRVPGRRATTKFPAPCPTPALIYPDGALEEKVLVVVVHTWAERLGEISPESIEREGATDMRDFRRRWCERYDTRFRPLDPVRVYQIRRFEPGDADAMGRVLLERLYG